MLTRKLRPKVRQPAKQGKQFGPDRRMEVSGIKDVNVALDRRLLQLSESRTAAIQDSGPSRCQPCPIENLQPFVVNKDQVAVGQATTVIVPVPAPVGRQAEQRNRSGPQAGRNGPTGQSEGDEVRPPARRKPFNDLFPALVRFDDQVGRRDRIEGQAPPSLALRRQTVLRETGRNRAEQVATRHASPSALGRVGDQRPGWLCSTLNLLDRASLCKEGRAKRQPLRR